jgi:hypothetical protein
MKAKLELEILLKLLDGVSSSERGARRASNVTSQGETLHRTPQS